MTCEPCVEETCEDYECTIVTCEEGELDCIEELCEDGCEIVICDCQEVVCEACEAVVCEDCIEVSCSEEESTNDESTETS